MSKSYVYCVTKEEKNGWLTENGVKRKIIVGYPYYVSRKDKWMALPEGTDTASIIEGTSFVVNSVVYTPVGKYFISGAEGIDVLIVCEESKFTGESITADEVIDPHIIAPEAQDASHEGKLVSEMQSPNSIILPNGRVKGFLNPIKDFTAATNSNQVGVYTDATYFFTILLGDLFAGKDITVYKDGKKLDRVGHDLWWIITVKPETTFGFSAEGAPDVTLYFDTATFIPDISKEE